MIHCISHILRKSPFLPLTLALGLSFGGCTFGERDSTGYADLPPEGWVYGDTVSIRLEIDSLEAHMEGTLEVGLRHTGEYPFSNLWLEIKSEDADQTVHYDTVGVDMCDSYGHWYGKGIGGSFQISEKIPRTVIPDTLTRFTVRHIMRVDTLHGISQIGILFRPASTGLPTPQ